MSSGNDINGLEFRNFLKHVKTNYQPSYVHVLVLNPSMEVSLTRAFFKGQLSDVLKYAQDRHGKIRMYLDGIRTMFTTGVAEGRFLVVLDAKEAELPDGTFTHNGGPGPDDNGGATPVAIRMAA